MLIKYTLQIKFLNKNPHKSIQSNKKFTAQLTAPQPSKAAKSLHPHNS